MFPGGIRNMNWSSEGLRAPAFGNGATCHLLDCEEHSASPAAFYRRQREAAPYMSKRKFNRKSPSRRSHRRVPYYPPSPSTSLSHPLRMKLNRPKLPMENTQTLHQLPTPGMSQSTWIRMKLEREETAQDTPLP